MEIATGTVTIAQESRFQLRRDDGSKQLFTLSRHAGLDAEDLARLARTRRPIVLHWRPVPGLLAGEARAIEVAR